MIYFTTNSDGGNTEGIGAMAQYQIACYVVSKLYNVEFYFEGFKNLTHYQYFNITPKQWDSDITKFFNLPISSKLDLPLIDFSTLKEDLKTFIGKNNHIIIKFEPSTLMSFLDQYIDTLEVENILRQIENNILLNDNLKYYSNNKTNIAIHIRKFSPTDADLNPRREYFGEYKKAFYINIINKLQNPNVEIHVFSQGDEKEFDFLNEFNIKKHIEENPLISLYHMIKADILVTANSSLSYVAHLLGNHDTCFVRSNFFQKWKNKTIKI